MSFKECHDLETRIRDRERIEALHPGYIPTIVNPGSESTPPIKKQKYMLSRDLTGAQLIYIIRRRVALDSRQALFLLCNGRMITANDVLVTLHERNRDPEDGYLYITYTLENAFGSSD